MVKNAGKDEIQKRLIEAARKKWETVDVEKILTDFENAADAIWNVKRFKLKSEEEPAYPTTIFYRVDRGKKRGKEV
jgi:hypothetical protein